MKKKRRRGVLRKAWDRVSTAVGGALAYGLEFFGSWVPVNRTTLVLVAGLVLAYFLGGRVRSEARALEDFTVYPEVCRPEGDVPRWLSDEDLAGIRDALASVEPFSIFETGLLPRLAEALGEESWTRGVRSVRRVFPNGVELTLEIRKPIAAVFTESGAGQSYPGRYYLVDRRAVRLRGQYVIPPSGLSHPLPVIRGARFSNPPKAGEVWNDEAVQEGLAVALELYALYNSDLGDRIRIREIDVSNVHGIQNPQASEIVLRTERDVPIQWGRSLLYEGYGENSTARKLELLRRLDKLEPGLAFPGGVSVLWDESWIGEVR